MFRDMTRLGAVIAGCLTAAVCSATLHVLCLIRSKLHDLKRQRKERLGELLQVITCSFMRHCITCTADPSVVLTTC